jgi:hypothetical protein
MPRFGSTYKRWKYDSSGPMPMSTVYASKKHAEKRKRNSEYSVYNGKDIDLIDQRALNNIEDICYDDVNIEINEDAFFCGRMTHHSMSIQLKLWNAVLDDFVPKNFNELCKIILKDENDKITYEKTWYCNRCKNYVVVNDKKQRKCIICKQRLLIFYHLKLANQVRQILSSLNM